ncbi:hypothetical protein STRATTON_210 [Erwinia phage vB_EamM_Stratton]|uniref:Transmembrane protein n=2 Tax=Erskinevirus EaH2 TaxID=2169883 RepID=A0A1B2IHD7_9CAUD|nr:hypothetical protein G173_gp113 [Erwinia phage phiEaH2]AFQ96658.1 hypothetical protein [Erwinia phage phiEaH2]ANZ50635.1 hypothetical protein STRATTON_210 [Erwinia phage vB_EamM_Stratton]
MAKRRIKSKLKMGVLLSLHVLVVAGVLFADATPIMWLFIFLIFIEGIYVGRLTTRPPLLRDPAYDNRETA